MPRSAALAFLPASIRGAAPVTARRLLSVPLAVLIGLAGAMLPAAVAQAAPAAVRVTATALPPLPGEDTSRAWAINDRGEVVGSSGEHAVKWVDGVPVALPAPEDAEAPLEARGVGEDGTAVGRDGFERFCVWSATALCGTVSYGWSAYALDVNGDGLVVGGTDDEYAERGWWWDLSTGTGPVLIAPQLPADGDAENSGTRVAAVNAAGQIAGTNLAWLQDGAGRVDAFVLADGVMELLDSPGGDSSAADINDAGVVVGTAGGRATLWSGGAPTTLGTLGGAVSEARAVNEAGEVVGISQTADGQWQAFLWSDGAIAPLETDTGALTGQVRDLNDRGQIVGDSWDDQGRSVATVWTVVETAPAPEEAPSTGLPEGSAGDGDDADGVLDGDSTGGGAPQPDARPSAFDGGAAGAARVSAASVTAQAAAVSQARFAEAGADHAVLARSDVFADSLAGAALLHDGPMLLVESDSLPADTAAELQRVLAAGRPVHLLGGEQAVSAAVAEAVADLGYEVVRLAGGSRVETAVAVAEEVLRRNPSAGDVVLARSDGSSRDPSAAWADSITGGGWAAATGSPLLLTPTDGVHPAVAAFLADMEPARTVLLGGTAALSPAVESAVPHPQRIAGLNRADTAAQVAEQLWAEGTARFVVINGYAADGWAHGLPAAGISADADAPLLVSQRDALPPETAQRVSSACESAAVELLLVGAEAQVSGGVATSLGNACSTSG